MYITAKNPKSCSFSTLLNHQNIILDGINHSWMVMHFVRSLVTFQPMLQHQPNWMELRSMDSHIHTRYLGEFFWEIRIWETIQSAFPIGILQGFCYQSRWQLNSWLSSLAFTLHTCLRDVTTGATGATAVAPKFLDTLTLSQPGGADSAHHCRGRT